MVERFVSVGDSKKKFGLKAKLIIAMMVTGIFPLFFGMVLSYVRGNESLKEVIGSSFQTLARETANKIDFIIDKEIAKNRQTSFHSDVIEWLKKPNSAFEDLDPARLEADFAKADPAWQENVIQSIINNGGTQALQAFLKEPSHSSESTRAFYVTDAKGILVASINNYPPFATHQDKIKKIVERDGVYFSDVYLDKQLNEYVFQIILPIYDEAAHKRTATEEAQQGSGQSPKANPLIGLLYRVYSVKGYFSSPLETIRFGDTGHIMIIDSKGMVIDCPILPTGHQIKSQDVVRGVTLPSAGWTLAQNNGHGAAEDSLIGFSPMFKTNALLDKANENRWHTFAWQSSEELFAPTRKLLFWNATAVLLGVLLIGIIGNYGANRIIQPIRKLQKAIASIAQNTDKSDKGKVPMAQEINVGTNDEIAELAESFNKMSRDLSATRESELKHLDELEQTLLTLAESETRVTTIMNNVVDGIITIDEHGQMLSFNPAAERIFGRKAEETLGKNVSMLMGEPERTEHDGYIQRYLSTGTAKIIGFGREVIAMRKDGSLFHMDLAVSEMTLGDRRLFVGVMRDITQRKMMETDLRKLSRAVEQSPSSVLITNGEGRIEYVNPNFIETSGYSYEEIIGQKPSILKSGVHPPQFYKHLWETILSGKEWRGEFCNRKKNGELFWELQSISPLRDIEGRITHYLSVKIDDTERKRAEEQLKLYASELERSNESLKDFAAIASHDLQEPLRKIVSFGDRLMKDYSENLDERGRDYLQRMQAAAERMKNFIYDLLNYSKVASKPREFKPVDLRKTVDEVLIDLETRIKQTHGQVNIANLPLIEADDLMMRQLFQNLIANALKFHKPGVPPVVDLTCRFTSRGFWEICVEDNGIGFDMKYHDRIFKPFQRLHGRSHYEGSGMGLAICQKIVVSHGGIFSAKSVPMMGTKFIILLPERQATKESGFVTAAS